VAAAAVSAAEDGTIGGKKQETGEGEGDGVRAGEGEDDRRRDGDEGGEG
jgi:hypothetical protein